jgi:MFS family permease
MKLNRNITLYYVNQAMSGMVFTIPVWVFFQHRLLSYTQMAWMQSASFVVAILLQLPTGAFADVFGRKKAIMLGWLIAGFANIYVGLSTSAVSMIIGLLFVSIGTTFVSGADVALLFDTLKQLGRSDEFSKINARGLLVYRLTMIGAILLGGFFYQINIGLPIICKGIAQLLIILAAWNMIEPSIDTEKFTPEKYIGRLKLGISNLFRNSHIRLLSFYYIFVGGITWSCLFYLVNTFASDIGFSAVEQSWLFAGIYVISTSAILLLTEHKTFLKQHKHIVFIAFPIIMLLSLLPGIVATKTLGSVMLVFIVFAGGSRFAILDGIINEEFGSEARATTLSTLNLIVQLLTALIIFVNGPIQEKFTSKPMISILGIVTLIVVFPLSLMLYKRSRSILH